MIFLFNSFSVTDWTSFLGRFHPLLIHLPIGFLLIVLILEALRMTGKIYFESKLLNLILLITAISATLACIAGYFLSLEGGYNEETLEEHQLQGIGLSLFTWIAWFSKNEWILQKTSIIEKFYQPTLFFSIILMFIAGHHGGNLTHGETYLADKLPQPFRGWFGISNEIVTDNAGKPKITNINEALVYNDIVHPIFKEKCEQCHNANKMKSDLRMDNIELFQKGGKHGVIFKANNVTESEFIKRILLPESDEHHMPPKGKNQITENELSLLKWWVEQGATFDKKVSQLAVNESIKPILFSLGSTSVTSITGVKQDKFIVEEQILTKEISPINSSVKEEIKKTGGLILPLAQNNNYVEISYINNSKLSDKDVLSLPKIAEQAIWLKLSNTQITDNALPEIAKLINLTRLHLEKTKITDKGLEQLKPLQNLEYLNLIGTSITDNGLKAITALKNLKKLYIWQTKVTQAGIDNLKKTLPNLNIDFGFSEQQVAKFDTSKTTSTKDDVYKKK